MIVEMYLDISPSPKAREIAELFRQVADRIEQNGVPRFQQLQDDNGETLGVIRSSHRSSKEVRHG